MIQQNASSSDEVASSAREFSDQAERLNQSAMYFKVSDVIKQDFLKEMTQKNRRKTLKREAEKKYAAEEDHAGQKASNGKSKQKSGGAAGGISTGRV